MSADFTNKRVLVTGGAGGIGLAIAKGFVRAGAKVAIFDRLEDELAKVAAELTETGPGSAIGIQCDLSDSAAITAGVHEAAQSLGGIDVLVNNAGIGHGVPLVDSDDEYIDAVLNVNLRAVLLITREVVKVMKRQVGGNIVNISSQAARRGYPDISHYSASKAGVLGFTVSLAVELAPAIRVNAVSPGMVETPMMKNNIEQTSQQKKISWDEAYAEWTSPIPLGRMQQPDDIAHAVLFIASDEASEITGETLNVSGGLVMW